MSSLFPRAFLMLLALTAACGDDDEPAGDAGEDTGSLASCEDGVRNGDESHADCGGSLCEKCPAGSGCQIAARDCVSGVCVGGYCLQPTCMDEVKNGIELGVDCGGPCDKCPGGQPCNEGNDCLSGVCGTDSLCLASSCEDEMLSGNETDVDCGGGTCPGCSGGGMCGRAEDCASGICDETTCTEPSCDDDVKNDKETDVDCGGSECDPCRDTAACDRDRDCESGRCFESVCISCMDGFQNGEETDRDCGGSSCDPCPMNRACREDDDCNSRICVDNVCTAAACDDELFNGDESDEDCGGSCETNCEIGERCRVGADCVTGVCGTGMRCAAPTCTDHVKNGDETDVDCGGPTPGCDRCIDLRACAAPTDCTSAMCSFGRCGDLSQCDSVVGPDAAGYLACIGTPDVSPCPDISSMTPTATGLTDEGEANAAIGFTFPFFGVDYTSVTLSANAVVAFGHSGDIGTGLSCPFPSDGDPEHFIAAFWDDLDPGVDGADVYYKQLGTSPDRTFVVQWDAPHYSASDTDFLRVQVVLQEGGGIRVCYPDTIVGSSSYNSGASASAGIQGLPTDALSISCDMASLASGTVVDYFAP